MKHAQALVYPLSVALKSPRGDRKEAADSLMNSLRQHSNKLIDQALMVSEELVRVAILWEEKWHWALEEASRQYFGDGNVQAMLNTLVPLHEAVELGVATMREVSFVETYHHEIFQAWECLKTYKKTMADKNCPIPTQKLSQVHPESIHLAQAWDFYYSMFKRINAQLPHINALDLQSCSPALFNANDLDLGVPGTYAVCTNAIRIKSFSPVVQIIRSKQRPRRVRICGEDGQEFGFLLKVIIICGGRVDGMHPNGCCCCCLGS
jgi:FKBP12-rapamycin complex-associated protein